MRNKVISKKIADAMIIGGVAIIAFCIGAKFEKKRGVR